MVGPFQNSGLPRIIVYHQTTHVDVDGDLKNVSLLPLIEKPAIAVTHVILAAVHVNKDPRALTLNDHRPTDPRFDELWEEVDKLKQRGVTVMCMLGGAAKGTFASDRLGGDQNTFETYYAALFKFIKDKKLQGIDLDVEEEMSLDSITRLIGRLRQDFGDGFVITLAPVASALLDPSNPKYNMSGFSYKDLDARCRISKTENHIAWYNAQFYNGWGDASNSDMYAAIIQRQFDWLQAERLVMGVLTTERNGNGFVHIDRLRSKAFPIIKATFPGKFGGVMGWEYFNSHVHHDSSDSHKINKSSSDEPWEWAQHMSRILKGTMQRPKPPPRRTGSIRYATREIDPDATAGEVPRVPDEFSYDSDSLDAKA